MKTIIAFNKEEVDRIGILDVLSELKEYSNNDAWEGLLSKKEKAVIQTTIHRLENVEELPELTVMLKDILIIQKAIGFVKGKKRGPEE